MQELANIFIKSIFIDNMVFAYFLGMCSYLAISKTVKTSVGMGFAVIFVLGFTVPINFLLEKFVLKPGALTWISNSFIDVDLSFLSFIMFIAIIASMVQLVEMIVEKLSLKPWLLLSCPATGNVWSILVSSIVLIFLCPTVIYPIYYSDSQERVRTDPLYCQ